jgi:hypothetical protein
MIDDHGTCTHCGYGVPVGNGKAVTLKKVTAERSKAMEILDRSILDKKWTSNFERSTQKLYVVRSEYQPERKRKHGSTVFIPKCQENGNIRDKSGPRVLVREP